MRIRLPFAAIFFLLLLLAGYAGLTSLQLDGIVNDKILHAVTFFLLTLVFYWIVDTNRRRTMNMALVVCTGGLGVGSEVLQGLLPNGRVFDMFDIVANIVGSLAALGLCSWYHKRMLERKRERKYTAVPGEEGAEGVDGEHEQDVELGVVHADTEDEEEEATSAPKAPTPAPAPVSKAAAPAAPARTLEEEVDNWDENAEDPWDDDDGDIGGGPAKKRTD